MDDDRPCPINRNKYSIHVFLRVPLILEMKGFFLNSLSVNTGATSLYSIHVYVGKDE